MGTVTRFEELDVWQNARDLTNLVYDLSDEGSFARDFVLRDQMRRSAVSIMSNIAEGFESRTQTLFIDFLGRNKASAGELRCQFYIALDRGYISEQEFEQANKLVTLCSKQLARFVQYLETNSNTRRVRENNVVYEFAVEP